MAGNACFFSPFKHGPKYLERLLLKGYKNIVRFLGSLYNYHYRRLIRQKRIDLKKMPTVAAVSLIIGDSYMLDGRYGRAAVFLSQYKDAAERILKEASSPRGHQIGLAMTIRYYLLVGDNESAIFALQKSLEANPEDVRSLSSLVKLTAEVGLQKEAEDLYRRLMSLDSTAIPQITHYVLIPSGDLRPVWHSYAVYKTPHPRSAKLWEGQDISSDSLMVVAVSGVGDEIRGASSYDELAAKAGSLTIVCDPRLDTIFRRSFPRAWVMPMVRAHIYGLGKGSARTTADRNNDAWTRADYYVNNLASLQYTRPTLQSFRNFESRLIADPALVAEWRKRIEGVRKGQLVVGLCWRSGIISYTRRKEYYDLADWAPVLDVENVLFVNLQYYGQEEIRKLKNTDKRYSESILEISDADLQNDFEALAALIQCCDLVISSPTNILEYAGILGKEAWMVTASSSLSASWRVLEDDRDVWFKSVKHYSVMKYGDKNALIEGLSRDLATRIAEFKGSR